MGLSSSGIGSGLDVEGLVSKLMAAEAKPLANYDKKSAAIAAKVAALAKLSGAVGMFQGALSALSSPATFKALSASSADEAVLTGSASSTAVPGKYTVNVTQLAQAQSLKTSGLASMSALLGTTATTLSFQFGSVSGGQFGVAGSALGAAVTSGGIANGALTINGTAIATDGATRSARQLAEAINAKSATTGVTASAASTSSGAGLFTGFGDVAISGAGSYTLAVNGVQLAAVSGAGAALTAADLDSALGGAAATALAAANISFTGKASDGTLQFFAADGSNLTVSESVAGSGSVSGGIGKAPLAANTGSSVTSSAGVTLSSSAASPITIGGSAPAAAGLVAGSAGSYLGAGFTQDGASASGSVVLPPGDQSLTGIRDAINKANLGISASIVSDGSASPYHLVLTSDQTGASGAMKISVSGDPALAALLGYDPGGAQGMTQTSAAQNTQLDVNGIAVTSDSTSVTGAIQGVTLDVAKLGSTSLTVTRDTKSVTDAVNGFVKAYNDLNQTIASLTSYDATNKSAAPLQGDTTVRSIQTTLRRQLGIAVEGAAGTLSTLSQVGVTFQRNGSLAVDSSKLTKAISDNFADIGGLFAALGSATDGLVSVGGSSAATKAGTYALNVTALATQGSLSGTAPAGPTVIAADTSWSVTLNQTDPITTSKVQSVMIPAGSYDSTQLAALLRAAINGNSTFAGAGDTVETSVANGQLTIASGRYGSTSNIALSALSGTDPASLFGNAPAVGTDIVGTIGGAAATGSGQTLSGLPGSPTEGLKLQVTGGSTGERGTVSFSQGYAYQLNNLAASFIGTQGLITGKSDGLNVSIKAISSERDRFSSRLADIEKRYRAQFSALDMALASMQSTSSYLTQQLASIANNS